MVAEWFDAEVGEKLQFFESSTHTRNGDLRQEELIFSAWNQLLGGFSIAFGEGVRANTSTSPSYRIIARFHTGQGSYIYKSLVPVVFFYASMQLTI
jgi:hypothetical protein